MPHLKKLLTDFISVALLQLKRLEKALWGTITTRLLCLLLLMLIFLNGKKIEEANLDFQRSTLISISKNSFSEADRDVTFFYNLKKFRKEIEVFNMNH